MQTGPLKGACLTFSEEEACTIGSEGDCSLRLEGSGVAAQHLVIKALKNGGFGVKQLQGSFLLNGKEIRAARLQDGDILEVAGNRLLFGPKPSEEPQMLGGFRLLEVLGKGGMGTVYRAEQVSLHREVALKILNKELTQDPVWVDRFVAEARSAARLSHPNVVQVFDVGHEGDTYFLAMEIMTGGSLEETLRSHGTLALTEVLDHIRDAAQALAYAESLNVVHRDIKPENLMLDPHGTVKLADLGLAMDHGVDQDGRLVGTPHFMSPEQVQRKPLDHRSDLYSLGCTFYRLATGKTPFHGKNVSQILKAQVQEEPIEADNLNAEIPSEVSAIILRLLAKDPDERYQSADALLAELDGLESADGNKKKQLTLLGVLLLALLVTGVALLLRGSGEPADPQIVIQSADPDPAIQDELRESKAKTALLEIQQAGLPPIAFAEQLEAMASKSEFKDTVAANKALGLAQKTRDKQLQLTQQSIAFKKELLQQCQQLREQSEALLKAGKFREAEQLWLPENLPAEMREESLVQETVESLRSNMQGMGKQQLEQIQTNWKKALQAKATEEADQCLQSVTAILDTETGWPTAMLADPANLQTFLQEGKESLRNLRNTLAASGKQKAWASYDEALLGKHGILQQVRAANLSKAKELAASMVQATAGHSAAKKALQFQEMLTAIAAYLEQAQVSAALQEKGPVPESSKEWQEYFIMPGNASLHDGRMALLACMQLHELLQGASAYLQSLDVRNDLSGTQPQNFANEGRALLERATELAKSNTPWAKALAIECQAASQLAKGLHSLATRRNQRAAILIEKVLQEHANSLACRKLH